MRVLIGYPWAPGALNGRAVYEDWIGRLRAGGYQVEAFCLTPNPPAPTLTWMELDWRWRTGEAGLMKLYEDLARRCEHYDVFLNYTGVHIHRDFVRQLPTFNVFSCFDDPESSDDLSKPVAAAYDLALVGNIAEVQTYRSWGVKNVRWWPLGFRANDFDPNLNGEDILRRQRDVELTLLCERKTRYRRARLDAFVRAFPEGRYHGMGWPAGYLPEKERVPLLQRTRIGINLHNSSGPINFRTYYLPANGVMQLCDNKSHLKHIYELDKEVVGFDSIAEATELCRYYLAHDEERRAIAKRGWERAMRDYNEHACFAHLARAVEELRPLNPSSRTETALEYLDAHFRSADRRWVIRWISDMQLRFKLLIKKLRRRFQLLMLG